MKLSTEEKSLFFTEGAQLAEKGGRGKKREKGKGGRCKGINYIVRRPVGRERGKRASSLSLLRGGGILCMKGGGKGKRGG